MNTSKENVDIIEPFLKNIVAERKQSSIVIHEAVEALGNLSEDNLKELLAQFDDECDDTIIKETCELALDQIKWREETEDGKLEGIDLKALKHPTNDPSPPFNPDSDVNYRSVSFLTKMLLDDKVRLFDRYRAMFTLREMHTDEAVIGLC